MPHIWFYDIFSLFEAYSLVVQKGVDIIRLPWIGNMWLAHCIKLLLLLRWNPKTVSKIWSLPAPLVRIPGFWRKRATMQRFGGASHDVSTSTDQFTIKKGGLQRRSWIQLKVVVISLQLRWGCSWMQRRWILQAVIDWGPFGSRLLFRFRCVILLVWKSVLRFYS